MALELNSNNYFAQYDNNYTPGANGLSGFKTWECYMLIKYGNAGNFGAAGKQEYLIELPLYPDEVTETISTNWSKQKILGRSSEIAAYAGTDLKTVNFSFDLHRDFLTGSYSAPASKIKDALSGTSKSQIAGHQVQSDSGPFGTRSWYVNMNKMLQMSCYPQYLGSGMIPPTTYFIFGQMILKGFVDSYSTTWKKPILNTFYGWNSVQLTMSCYPDSIITAHDFINGSGSQSTQNTYNTRFPSAAASRSDVMTRTANNEFRSRGNSRSESGRLGGQVIDT